MRDAKAFMAKAGQTPEIAGLFSGFNINAPQLYADVDRVKARQLGVAVTDVFDTMQIYLGSLYVNDFNKFGRTYSVRVQADAQHRGRAEDIGRSATVAQGRATGDSRGGTSGLASLRRRAIRPRMKSSSRTSR